MDRRLLISYILLIPAFGYLLTITYISLLTRSQAFFLRNSYFSRLEKRSLGREILGRSWGGRPVMPGVAGGNHFPTSTTSTTSSSPSPPAPLPEACSAPTTLSGIPTPPGQNRGTNILICECEKATPPRTSSPAPSANSSPSFPGTLPMPFVTSGDLTKL